jgi:deoxycytidine triphosphate deaminase
VNINPKEVIAKGIISGIDERLKEGDKEYQIQQVGVDLRIAEDLILEPMTGKNIQLMEKFNMQEYVGYLWIRSSLSRKLIFASFGIFDPFFSGVGGISLYNFGKEAHIIYKGFRVCQMVVYPANYASKYNGFYNQNQTIQSQY